MSLKGQLQNCDKVLLNSNFPEDQIFMLLRILRLFWSRAQRRNSKCNILPRVLRNTHTFMFQLSCSSFKSASNTQVGAIPIFGTDSKATQTGRTPLGKPVPYLNKF